MEKRNDELDDAIKAIEASHLSFYRGGDCCLTALNIELVKVLKECTALCQLDIDAVRLFGYGFSRHHGKPMHVADQIGHDYLI